MKLLRPFLGAVLAAFLVPSLALAIPAENFNPTYTPQVIQDLTSPGTLDRGIAWYPNIGSATSNINVIIYDYFNGVFITNTPDCLSNTVGGIFGEPQKAGFGSMFYFTDHTLSGDGILTTNGLNQDTGGSYLYTSLGFPLNGHYSACSIPNYVTNTDEVNGSIDSLAPNGFSVWSPTILADEETTNPKAEHGLTPILPPFTLVQSDYLDGLTPSPQPQCLINPITVPAGGSIAAQVCNGTGTFQASMSPVLDNTKIKPGMHVMIYDPGLGINTFGKVVGRNKYTYQFDNASTAGGSGHFQKLKDIFTIKCLSPATGCASPYGDGDPIFLVPKGTIQDQTMGCLDQIGIVMGENGKANSLLAGIPIGDVVSQAKASGMDNAGNYVGSCVNSAANESAEFNFASYGDTTYAAFGNSTTMNEWNAAAKWFDNTLNPEWDANFPNVLGADIELSASNQVVLNIDITSDAAPSFICTSMGWTPNGGTSCTVNPHLFLGANLGYWFLPVQWTYDTYAPSTNINLGNFWKLSNDGLNQ